MEGLNTRTVLVTGSNRGIGLEIVKQLVGQGNRPACIFATCRDPEGPGAQELRNLAAKHQGIEIIPLDTCKLPTIKAAAARVTEKLNGAGLNLLINNAGILKLSTVESETEENMAQVYKTNVIGPMLVSQAFLPLLRKAAQESPQKGMSCGKAAIVNMSSECGSITNLFAWEFDQVISYRCSKTALNMLTRCQSQGFAKDEILCITFHPGWLQTDMGNQLGPPPLTLECSVRGVLKTLAGLSEKDNGAFVNWEGKNLPW
ncbi:C-signal-like [Elgaria multicarinata webbii]|uniref:C-signal-like n=1 Tax=Elgaria multicarinata webbii TaxID=159646 RepID=UPI002FCD1581